MDGIKNINLLDVNFDLSKMNGNLKNYESNITGNINTLKQKENIKILNKCFICKKKLIISANYSCPCDNLKRYCPTHRFPEEHSCTKEKDKIILDKVVAEKVQKI
jgi:hypothetical protein